MVKILFSHIPSTNTSLQLFRHQHNPPIVPQFHNDCTVQCEPQAHLSSFEAIHCVQAHRSASSHLRGERSSLFPPGEGGAGCAHRPAVQPQGLPFMDVHPLGAHLDLGQTGTWKHTHVHTHMQRVRRRTEKLSGPGGRESADL